MSREPHRLPAPVEPARAGHFGYAWLALCVAFAAHVTDEALTGFLPIYNATVLAERTRYPWYPMPTFGYREWLYGLIAGILICFVLTPLAFRNTRGLRPFAHFYAVVMFLNGMGHTLVTIFGRGPIASIPVPRPAPGFYSSPLLFVGSIWLFVSLIRTRKRRRLRG